ncbi:hypothetical protein [Mangrovibacterium diazotrophicum]|uniref:Uncharacterized protein n=1 Tax=Mangrovibacterium diazotrophicum TaxID=1261403 RepID=A0A419VWC6_9BACT|nr:hypothetical protein [Mangrovibacterium diazotrophicum]RKD86411.1 hypothetical protein BC643_4102 [Mangrovibacterium diazotrophicum]
MKLKYFAILILVVVGCKNQIITLNNIVINNGQVVVINDSTNIELDKIFNGEFIYKIDGNLCKKGYYSHRKAVGKWRYNVSPNREIEINWNKDVFSSSNLNIVYPEAWNPVEVKDSNRIVTFDLQPRVEKEALTEDYFTVMKHSLTKENALANYNGRYKSTVVENWIVLGVDSFLIKIDEKKYLFNRFVLDVNGYSLYVYNLNTTISNDIIDVTMVVKNEDASWNQLLFFETMRNIDIDQIELLPKEGIIEIIPLGDSQRY